MTSEKDNTTSETTPPVTKWDTFFLRAERPSEDFMQERGDQLPTEREPFAES